MTLLLTGIGGFIGAILRQLLSSYVQGDPQRASFPWGTFVVNAIGCLLIGFLAGLAETRGQLSPEARAFLVVGLLGGFTTFSAFAAETTAAMRGGLPSLALANVVGSVATCLIAAWGGGVLARLLLR